MGKLSPTCPKCIQLGSIPIPEADKVRSQVIPLLQGIEEIDCETIAPRRRASGSFLAIP
jgi:hypothetical protein